MARCSVNNCRSNNDKRLKRNKDEAVRGQIKYFRFPKDEALAKIWEHKCQRKNKINHKNSYICSKHFKREHYFRNMQHELLNYSPRSCRKINLDAIPTENLPDISAESVEKVKIEPSAVEEIDASIEHVQPPASGEIFENDASTECAQPHGKLIENIKLEVQSLDTADIIESNTSILAESVEKMKIEPSAVEEICDHQSNLYYIYKATLTDTAVLEIEVLKLRAENERLQKECHFLKTQNKKMINNNVELQKKCRLLKATIHKKS